MPKVAQSPSDLLSKDQILALSGLEFMQGILNGSLPAPPNSNDDGL